MSNLSCMLRGSLSNQIIDSVDQSETAVNPPMTEQMQTLGPETDRYIKGLVYAELYSISIDTLKRKNGSYKANRT